MSRAGIGLLLSTLAAAASAHGQSAQATLAPGTVFKDCETCPELVVIPAGEFTMGTPLGAYERLDREGPQIEVTFARPFALGRYELTYEQFERFVEATGYSPTPGCRVWDEMWTNKESHGWRNPAQPERPAPSHPVVCVSWLDAQAYLKWLSGQTGQRYRLPSEAEWEYAARGGTTAPRFWGPFWNEGCPHANQYDIAGLRKYPFDWVHAACNDGYAGLAPVGSYEPNPFGLYDVIGNVWEWTEDCYTASYDGAPKDGRPWVWQGGCERRSVRGGSWITTPARNRVAFRGRDPEDTHANYFGFRVARDLDPE